MADPYWGSTVLACPFTGTNGDAASSDESDTPHTLTFVADAQITRDNPRQGRTSLNLDGTGDYVNVGDSADFDLAAGDFCIEFWVYVGGTEWAGAGMFASNWDGSSSNQSWKIEYSPALNAIYWWYSTTGADTGTANFDFDTDGAAGGPTDFFDRNWHHVAIVRTGSTTCVHFDGVPGAGTDATNPTLYTNSGIDTLIGAERSGAGVVNVAKACQIQDFRVTKGNSRYRAGVRFTPPKLLELGDTTVDELFDDVVCLIKGNGADASTTFTDEGPLGLTCTVRGTGTQVDTAFAKFGTGSIYHTSTSSGIVVGASTDETPTDIEDRDFTIEFWVRAAAEPTNGWVLGAANATSAPDDIGYALAWNTTDNLWRFRYSEDAVTDYTYDYDVDTDGDAIGPTTMWDGTWRHVVVCRENGVLMTFLDGKGKVHYSSTFHNFWFSTVRPLLINGLATASAVTSGSANLWMDDFRITMACRYHADFTPPTTEHPTQRRADTITDASWANVKLLLEGDTQRGDTTFLDTSDSAATVTNVGTVPADMDNKLHGIGAITLNGSSQYLSIPDSTALTFGSNNFTIEFWYLASDTEPGSSFTWISKYDLIGSQEWQLRYDPATNQIRFLYSTNGTSTTTITHDLSLSIGVDDLWNGEWHHIAVTREGTAIHIHVDGDESSSGTDPGGSALADTTRAVIVGARFSGATPGEYMPGTIDGLRITNGSARYSSADFTPNPLPWGAEGAAAETSIGAITTVVIS